MGCSLQGAYLLNEGENLAGPENNAYEQNGCKQHKRCLDATAGKTSIDAVTCKYGTVGGCAVPKRDWRMIHGYALSAICKPAKLCSSCLYDSRASAKRRVVTAFALP